MKTRLTLRVLDPVLWGIVLPPFVFFGWMLWGGSTIGNDYPVFQVRSAQSLRLYDTLGLEPMWYPHLGGGIPVGGLILAQYFHLPAWLVSRMPGFWDGHALEWITVRQLLLFAILHAAFYRGCRRLLGTGRTASYLLSLVFVYNGRMLDAFRYGPGLDVAVYGQCAMLLALTCLLRPDRTRLVLLALTTQLALTGGYPVLLPLFLLASAAAMALLLASGPPDLGTTARHGAAVAGAAAAGVLLAAPALAAIADFLGVNQARVARPTLEWASAWSMPAIGPLQSALLPWTAEAHAACGGSTLIALVLVALAIWAVSDLRHRWAVLLILLFPFVYAYGAASPVFRFFFHHVPGFASLRVPARMLAVLPMLVFAALAAMHRRGALDLTAGPGVRSALQYSAAVNAAGLATALVLVAAGFTLDALAADLSPLHLTAFWSRPWQALWLGLGLAASGAFALVPRRRAGGVLLAVTFVQTGLVMAHGTWITPKPPGATREAFAAANQLPLYGEWPFWATNALNEHAEGSATVAYTRFIEAAGSQANCYLPVDPDRRKRGILLPFYLSTNIVAATSREEALDRLKTEGGCRYDGSTKTLVTGMTPAAEGTAADLASANARNRVLILQPNRVQIVVETPRDAVLITPFPEATGNWSVALDGHAAAFVTVDGAFLGVPVPAGGHTVDVAYFSRGMQLGWRVFLATVALVLAAAAGMRVRRAGWRWIAAALVGAAATIGAVRLDRWYSARAKAAVLLPNSYADLLRRQLERWRP